MDVKECRENVRCTELAGSPALAQLFRNLAKQWLKNGGLLALTANTDR
jgi:hypothetical protein